MTFYAPKAHIAAYGEVAAKFKQGQQSDTFEPNPAAVQKPEGVAPMLKSALKPSRIKAVRKGLAYVLAKS